MQKAALLDVFDQELEEGSTTTEKCRRRSRSTVESNLSSYYHGNNADHEPPPYTAAARIYYKIDTVIAHRRTQIGLIFMLMVVSIALSGVALWSDVLLEGGDGGADTDDDELGGGSGDGNEGDDGADKNVGEHIWDAWTYMADPGTHGEVTGMVHRALAATTAIVGIFFMSVIFGIVVDTIREKMDELKKVRTV